MASSFSELLKIAKAHSDDTKREALEAAKRREAALRQAREEQDRRERAEKELQKKLALKRAEEAKKEEERKKQREEEIAKRRGELAKKKEEVKEESRSGRSGRADGSAPKSKYINTSSTALTREEKRMAKDPLYKDELGKGKAKAAAIQKLKNGRLPGGALPIVENGSGGPSKNASSSRPSGSSPSMTARARLSAKFPPTLTQLNPEKRDLRSLDEITRDLKKGKPEGPQSMEQKSTISGPQASSYNDWFGKKKDKAPEQFHASTANRKDLKPPGSSSGGAAPTTRPKTGANQASSSSQSTATKKSISATSANTNRKRSRSSDLDESDSYDSDDRYYHEKRSKRPMSSRNNDDDLQGDMRELIWGLMGKSRQKYTSMNVESDDDMEATGAELEREELQSARIARKEDAEAEADEKRRELEKKRRKMEKVKSK